MKLVASPALWACAIACNSRGPAASSAAARSDCRTDLDLLARFYSDVANDREASPAPAGLDEAQRRAGARELAVVDAPAADASHADLLVVGPERAALRDATGAVSDVQIDDLPGGGPGRSLVIVFGADVPWRVVDRVYHSLPLGERRYAAMAFGYRTAGAFAKRTPPHLPGAAADSVDLPRVTQAIDHELAAHCPALEQAFSSGKLDAASLRAGAAAIPSCSCDVDRAMVEAIPWFAASTTLAIVPFRAVPGDHPLIPDAAPDARFGDVVRANGGHALEIAVPPQPPPAPPPPRHTSTR